MIEIDNKVISRELFTEKFICDLTACKGACCVEGDAGAPLEDAEAELLEQELPNILPFLNEAGKKAIEESGAFMLDRWDGEKVTPLVNQKECAYTIFEEDGTAKCGIENAFRAGKTSFNKPISCHLYPIRITKYRKFDAINYHQWDICKAARTCGANLKVKVYKFLRTPLIRKYGEDFYSKLENVNNEYFTTS